MKTSDRDELRRRFGNRLLVDEPLSRYSTYRIGGPAAAMLFPRNANDIAEALEFCSAQGLRWVALGLGSNVLISDSGFQGLVVRMGKGIDGVLDRSDEDGVWHVAAGMPTPRLAKLTAKAGLAGVHRLVGVPGTVGGGVATNAGAYGQDFSRVVRSVQYVGPNGVVGEIPGRQVVWHYRQGLAGVVVTSATFEFDAGDAAGLQEETNQVLASRKEKTPFDSPCCGSVFKNPQATNEREEDSGSNKAPASAGQLVDAAGLKGFRIGAAEVSKKHANYIVNLGGATAAEVLAVIDAVRGRVFGAFGVELELEVRIVE